MKTNLQRLIRKTTIEGGFSIPLEKIGGIGEASALNELPPQDTVRQPWTYKGG